ncbi:hypothetical protein [Spartinivicinus ruber]|uniref:hypothetical protein n=1 Tax=Spartinivicinus ruber TaxID=2683272 RepID=UPI0013D69B42|nr:hypothetical protein [Spartinivicinus ruber]
MIIRINHIRSALFCSKGARQFFERHGLDWGDFLKHGIESEKLLATGDAMAKQVVDLAEWAEKRKP